MQKLLKKKFVNRNVEQRRDQQIAKHDRFSFFLNKRSN